MTTTPTHQQQQGDTSTGNEGGEEVTNAQLREYARRQKDEMAALRSQLVGVHLAKIGLQADKGLGKAIAQSYQGDVSPDAIAAYAATEYSYEAPTQQSAEEVQAAALASRQANADNLQSVSNPVTPTTRLDEIAAADLKLADPEANRADAQHALSLKLEQYLEDTR